MSTSVNHSAANLIVNFHTSSITEKKDNEILIYAQDHLPPPSCIVPTWKIKISLKKNSDLNWSLFTLLLLFCKFTLVWNQSAGRLVLIGSDRTNGIQITYPRTLGPLIASLVKQPRNTQIRIQFLLT